MKLAAREDISAPIDAVFSEIAEFGNYERAALRRGADVRRTDNLAENGVGMAWKTRFDFRGHERSATIELTDYEPSERLCVDVTSSGLAIALEIELVAMSRTRTRVSISVDARPNTIPARLMLQSMKLARQSLVKRFRSRISDFAADIEKRARAR